MRGQAVIGLGIVAAAALAVVLVSRSTDPVEGWRAALASGDPARQRTALAEIAAARDVRPLPEVTRVWEGTVDRDGLRADRHADGTVGQACQQAFRALGPDAAPDLLAWAESPPRFTACLLAAGLAMGGTPEPVFVKNSAQPAIRHYLYRFPRHVLEVPLETGEDWYRRAELLRDWRRAFGEGAGR